MKAINLFMSTNDATDIVTLSNLKRRYVDINETADGFEQYLLDQCVNGWEKEYRAFSIWSAYSEEADITFFMADDDEGNTQVVYYVWGKAESADAYIERIKVGIIKWQNI